MNGRFADDDLARFIAQANAQPAPPARETGSDGLRRAAEERAAARPAGPDMAVVLDVTVPPNGCRARLYRPANDARALALFLHGGGFVIGSVATHDRACRRLASASGVNVLSLDYRLAPEHPWPAAIDDAVGALKWIASHPVDLGFTPSAVAVAGDSAGGTIATLASIRLRDARSAALPRAQVLLYANTDLAGSGESMHEKRRGFALEVDDIEWFNAQWVPDRAMQRDPRVSPLFADDLHGLPDAVVVTCEHDPLRDQGEAYAARLRDAGVAVTLRREAGMVHNFLLWDLFSPACADAADRVAADLAAVLGDGR